MINYIKDVIEPLGSVLLKAIDHHPVAMLWLVIIIGMSADSLIDNLFTLLG